MGALRPANGRNDSVKLPLALIALSSCLMAQNAPPVLSGSGSIIFPSSTPGVTANSLYDTAGTLKWAGNTVITSAGGTLTGDLLVSGTVNIGSATDFINQGYFYGLAINNALSFDYGAAVRTVLIQDGSGNLRLRNNLSQDLWTWSDAGLATSYSSIVPSATDNDNLGSSSLEWLNVYAKTICISGTCLSAWPGSGTYLPLTGGTLTGDLLITGTANLGSATDFINQGYFYGLAINNALSFDYGAAVRTVLIQDGSGNLRLQNNLSQSLWTWSDAGLATSYSSIVPSATNSWVLGTYGLQWANIYTQGVCLSNICLTQWPALFNTQTSGGSLNVTYGPNPGPVPLFMTVSAATGSVSNIQCLVNGSVVAQFGITGTNLGTCSFFVPVGATYEISAGTGAILSLWTIWN